MSQMDSTYPKQRRCRTCRLPMKGHLKVGGVVVCPTIPVATGEAGDGRPMEPPQPPATPPSSPSNPPSEASVEIITRLPAVYPGLSNPDGPLSLGALTGKQRVTQPQPTPHERIKTWLNIKNLSDPRNPPDLTLLPFPKPMHPVTLPALHKLRLPTPHSSGGSASTTTNDIAVFEAARRNLGLVRSVCSDVGLYWAGFPIPGPEPGLVLRDLPSHEAERVDEASLGVCYTRAGGDVWVIIGRTPGSVDDARMILHDADEKDLIPLDG